MSGTGGWAAPQVQGVAERNKQPPTHVQHPQVEAAGARAQHNQGHVDELEGREGVALAR